VARVAAATGVPYHQPMTGIDDLSLFQRILLATDGTVTDLLALYTGEAIRVTKLEQSVMTGRARAELQHPEPARLLQRRILLSGAKQNYLYADSQFLFERFSAWMQQQLLETDRPIGLLWKEARLETFREVIAQGVEPDGAIAQHFGLPATEPFVARTYLVHHGGRPLGAITEKWPSSWFR